MSNDIRLPNVSGTPGSVTGKDPAQASEPRELKNLAQDIGSESFDQVLGSQLLKPLQEPIKFSAHASARLQSRNVNLGPEQMRKLNEAVDKAAAKGLDDTLILTKDAAFIVSVKNRVVVTALDRGSLDGNVFTNIDGAVVV